MDIMNDVEYNNVIVNINETIDVVNSLIKRIKSSI